MEDSNDWCEVDSGIVTLQIFRVLICNNPVGPSCTVPDGSYAIKELIQRFNSGCPADVHKYNDFDINPVQNGTVDDLYRDVELVDPRLEPDFDLVDRVAAAEVAKTGIRRLLEAHKVDVSGPEGLKTEKEDAIEEQTQ